MDKPRIRAQVCTHTKGLPNPPDPGSRLLPSGRPKSTLVKRSRQRLALPRFVDGFTVYDTLRHSQTRQAVRTACLCYTDGMQAVQPVSLHTELQAIIDRASEIIVGKPVQLRQALTCVLARGHLLIEDHPGVGKTTLSHLLARLLGLRFNRIQFTSDMLPADIIGAAVYDRETGQFHFHEGPLFTQVILADEINRATPKAQSALLEAMEERQVSVEGETRDLPEPFFVIATQNPDYHIGTYPLPESQLDRFLMRIRLGYPDPGAERLLWQGQDRRDMINSLQPCISQESLLALQKQVTGVHTSSALLDYLEALLQHTRTDSHYSIGLSPRAGLALLRASQAWALLHGRDQVLPEDIQAILPAVVIHRLRGADQADVADHELVERLIQAVPIP